MKEIGEDIIWSRLLWFLHILSFMQFKYATFKVKLCCCDLQIFWFYFSDYFIFFCISDLLLQVKDSVTPGKSQFKAYWPPNLGIILADWPPIWAHFCDTWVQIWAPNPVFVPARTPSISKCDIRCTWPPAPVLLCTWCNKSSSIYHKRFPFVFFLDAIASHDLLGFHI